MIVNNFKLNSVNNLQLNLSSEIENLNKGYYLDNLLAGGVQTSINPINDYEVIEFKYYRPNFFFNLNFFLNIFEPDNSIINGVTDDNYSAYKSALITELEKIQISKVSQYSLTEYKYKPEDYVKNSKPISDKISVLNTLKPQFDGYPSFYQTFGYPYYFNVNAWTNNRFKFANEPFLFNSFIKLDFFDSPKINSNNLVFSQTIHVNPRYLSNITLNDSPYSTYDLLTPRFNIKEGVETYNINWIKNFYINEYYVRVSFWDALNGELINMLPTSNFSKEKQWVQNQDTFNTKNLFLKYSFDNNTNEYKIFEYNTNLDVWNLQPIRFELYQLIFDKYWSTKKPNIILENNEPIIIDNIGKPKFELSEYEIKDVVKHDEFKTKVFETEIKLKNTGNQVLNLENILVTYDGVDERLSTDSISTSNYNQTPSFFQRNHYSFIQNQEDYMFLTPAEKRKSFNEFPITINKATQNSIQESFGEVLRVKLLQSKATKLKLNEERKVQISFELGKEFYKAFVGEEINVVETHLGTYIGADDYLNFYNLGSLLVIPEDSLRVKYKHIYNYTVTFVFTTESGEDITQNINVQIDYSVKK